MSLSVLSTCPYSCWSVVSFQQIHRKTTHAKCNPKIQTANTSLFRLVIGAGSYQYRIYALCRNHPISSRYFEISFHGNIYPFLVPAFCLYLFHTRHRQYENIQKDTAAFVISLLLFLALPDNGRLHLDKFMYPFFWMGYFMHKYIDVIMKHRGKLLIASLILFAILLPFYQKRTISTSPE